jgi:hypothetical protein
MAADAWQANPTSGGMSGQGGQKAGRGCSYWAAWGRRQRCKPHGLGYNDGRVSPFQPMEFMMNRQFLLVAVAWLVVGACILAGAAEPGTNDTSNPFAGKIVLVNMTQGTRNEVFMLENVKAVTSGGSYPFLVGTGIKTGSDRASWPEGLEVHLNLRFVASYILMTPEQWKDKQRAAATRVPEGRERPAPARVPEGREPTRVPERRERSAPNRVPEDREPTRVPDSR